MPISKEEKEKIANRVVEILRSPRKKELIEELRNRVLSEDRDGMDEEQIHDALTGARMAALMDAVTDMGIPVNFEEHFDVTIQFVDLYPAVKIIIPHMGGLNGGSQRILEAVGKKDNVHFDISLAGISEGLIREMGVHKFICGSDHPYGSPSWSIDRVNKLNVGEEEKQAIFSGNVLSLTGVE